MLENIEIYNKFKEKENSLNRAISKVQSKLEYLSKNYQKMPLNEVEKWNNWHDLEDRLTDRKKENLSNFYEWHFLTFGYNVYSI
jgi:hypothetical protein